ncbi:ABC transporter ATP-binding protein [Streptosporangium saharense]|uniref:Branched-chain amino acid transport system ATP-binding protein n=1 Tax=Streptosporangium saharense TaxID=1706840 RepID=A0A7W7VRF6_9ACTN|nr:ABC transporter ATP-binding protein [Streptosporangium saharense]MBB4919350.1 branched-chain amino acid transport system ATP-binding protein [Streptosporangium saharense]
MTSSLVLDDVTVARGGAPIVRGVSLTAPAGEVTALLGPNGAGKTTLLESVSGVIPITGGTVSLNGGRLNALDRVARARAGIAHVEQGRTVFPDLTVAENILVVRRGPGVIDKALELFPELHKRLDVAASLLSGGEQQMLVLARALAARPSALLIDEMSLGLAPVIVQRLLPVVRDLAASGVAVLLVEQFATLALKIADTAHVLSGGTLTYSGPAAGLRSAPERLHAAYLGEPLPGVAGGS